jgi:hypothetical protein
VKRFFLCLFLVPILILAAACHHNKDSLEGVKTTPMDMKEFEEDVVVPQALWKAMESVYMPLALDAEGKSVKEGESGDLLKKRPPLDPIPITVYLVEHTPGVLGGQNFELKYPVGGGILDYRVFIPETKNGTFFLKVKYGAEMDSKYLKVLYLSNAKVRDVGGQPMGNGCSRYFDVTKYWEKQMKGDGLMLNTVDARHISVTAGTLFFVAPANGKLRIAHLSIRDSRHNDLLCSSEAAK